MCGALKHTGVLYDSFCDALVDCDLGARATLDALHESLAALHIDAALPPIASADTVKIV